MTFEEYADREMLAMHVANKIAGELVAAMGHEDRACLAVPGGTTPGGIFDDLCAASLDWDRVDVVLTDERWVPENDPRSNARLVRQRLLVNRASAAHFLPLYRPAERPEELIAEIADSIAPALPLDVALIGMGADMHVASMFAGAAGLAEALAPRAPNVVAVRPDQVEEARVTLAAHVLDGAVKKHVVIYGEDKRAALDRAMSLPPEEAPIVAVLDGATVHWAA